jgi:murein L,D-transpeptidase YcbB/YkuD
MDRSGKFHVSRRFVLAGAAGFGLTMAASRAYADGAIDQILRSPRRGNWNTQFDADASPQPKVASNLPILSMETESFVERAIVDYSNIVARGGWQIVPERKKLQLGVIDPDVAILRRRLMISGDLSLRAGISDAFDTYVDAALKRFQRRHGLPDDGVMGKYTYASMNVSASIRLGQLNTNAERLKNPPDPLGERYVMVNIPAAQIEAVENGRVVQRHTAIVGKVDRQTPILDSKIDQIILNPYWTAPKSIIQKDIIPIVRKDPTYLERNKIRLFNQAGDEVSPESVDWSTDEAVNLMFRQDPSKINAMASTKINFPNSHAVYMHDTPEQSLFGQLLRFDSSGCVRVQNVRDLTTWLLENTPGWNRRMIETTIKTGINTEIPLADPVPVHFVYISAWSTNDGVVNFRDDIYGLDGVDELQLSSAL